MRWTANIKIREIKSSSMAGLCRLRSHYLSGARLSYYSYSEQYWTLVLSEKDCLPRVKPVSLPVVHVASYQFMKPWPPMSSEQDQRNKVGSPATTLEALSRTFLDSALDCIITMDATGRVREFNPAAERVFGFRRDEVVGKELARLIIPPRLRERHRQGLAHYLKTGEGPLLGRLIEIAALRRDGTEILVALAISATEIDGSPIFTAYLRDITEQKRTEDVNRRLAAIIESSGDEIGRASCRERV